MQLERNVKDVKLKSLMAAKDDLVRLQVWLKKPQRGLLGISVGPTLDFGSGHDLMVVRLSPHRALYRQHRAYLGHSLSLSLYSFPICARSLSLSLSHSLTRCLSRSLAVALSLSLSGVPGWLSLLTV